MAKYKLTADELLLVYLTFIAQTENGDPKLLLHAQERKSAAMLNGEVYNIPNEIDLSDVNTNMEVLKKINYQGANP